MTPDPMRRLQGALSARQSPAGDETVFLGLGGNIGDRVNYLNAAVRLLDDHPRVSVQDISSVYETDPVGPSTDNFYNIAVRILTDLAPLPLLRLCRAVETALGRVRTIRWGPRTIDIDVLLYGDRRIATKTLAVPHPQLINRAFVMVPLLEVAPGWRLPDGRTLATVIAGLAPIEGVQAIGRQVSLTPLPAGPPDVGGAPR